MAKKKKMQKKHQGGARTAKPKKASVRMASKRKPAAKRAAAKKPARRTAAAPRPRKPAGPSYKPGDMPFVTPGLIVRDPAASLDFYARAFGFREKLRVPGPDGRVMHAEMKHQDGVIMLGPEPPNSYTSRAPSSVGAATAGVYVYVEDVDRLFDQATAAGASVMEPLTDQFWGDRTCKLRDPDGHIWQFATNKRPFDAAAVLPPAM